MTNRVLKDVVDWLACAAVVYVCMVGIRSIDDLLLKITCFDVYVCICVGVHANVIE